MRISAWSADVCSAVLIEREGTVDEGGGVRLIGGAEAVGGADGGQRGRMVVHQQGCPVGGSHRLGALGGGIFGPGVGRLLRVAPGLEGKGDAIVRVLRQRLVEQRSEEHTSELQSLMR